MNIQYTYMFVSQDAEWKEKYPVEARLSGSTEFEQVDGKHMLKKELYKKMKQRIARGLEKPDRQGFAVLGVNDGVWVVSTPMRAGEQVDGQKLFRVRSS